MWSISPCRRLWLNRSTYSATAHSRSPTPRQPPRGRITGLRMHSALNQGIERLRHRVVIRIPLGANRSNCMTLVQTFGVAHRSILHTSVAVMNQPGHVLSHSPTCPQPHAQGIERELGMHRCPDLPADDHPRKRIENERSVGPPRMRSDVGQVRHPQHIGCAGNELSPDSVDRLRRFGAVTTCGLPTLDRDIPCKPSTFINRSTVHRATGIALRFRLACTLRARYTPRLSAWTF